MKRLALILSASLLLVMALPGMAFAQDAPSTADLSLAMDTMWVLVAAVLVIFMQAGFAMLEVGFSRMKNVGSVVAKILVNLAIAGLMFWAVGFAFAFSDGGSLQRFIGLGGFFLTGNEATYSGLSWTQVPISAKFVFQVAFVAVSLAIVWGTMLERTKFAVYVIFAVVFAGLIYPLVAHWVWGGGWLSELGKQDFAGSTVVHLSGAAAALAGTLLLGPRLGKYDDEGRPVTIPGHNMPLAVLGVLILWVGWYGFNAGSTMAATTQIADVALTTTLAACGGVIGAMGMSYIYRKNVDVGMGGNGAIAALVGITASCAFVAPWAAVIIGLIAGVIMYITLIFVDKIGVDDPLGAIAAHGMGGVWGTLSTGFFATPELATVGQPGLFYGGGFTQLGVQALGIISVFAFVFLSSLLVFAVLKATIGLRVKPEFELDGLDLHEHGVYGYPDLVATDYQNGSASRQGVVSGSSTGSRG
ncbi:ammonium transporter [Rubrobacter indicoceani]|uniref:ammonium transporter n=1 Tax=Rubrobacter indicoceani TaxID=2051957 RepID=UPI001F097D2E|nr:ammonium transporter [Rubrobacter indicoceani]